MNPNTYVYKEKKDRKRGFFISFFLHTAIIAVGLLPFLSSDSEVQQDNTQFVVLDFTDFKPASSEGAAPAKSKAVQQQKKSVKKSVPMAKPVPKPKPAPETPKRKVNTAPSKERPVESHPTKNETVKEQPMEKPEPREDIPKTPTEAKTDEDAVKKTTATSNASEATKKSSKETGAGKGKKSDGKHNHGINVGDFEGDGIFNRRVIYRADVKKITKQEGKIVVNLCINREGKVFYAKANKDASTIKDYNVVRKAVHLTTRYRFERDYTAPEKQCGKLTYIFEM